MIGNFVFASNEQPKKEKTDITACCTQTGSSRTYSQDAQQRACVEADAKAKKSLEIAEISSGDTTIR